MFKLSNFEINKLQIGNFYVSKRENSWILELGERQWQFENFGIPHIRTISNCHFLIFHNVKHHQLPRLYILLDEWQILEFEYLYDDEHGIYVSDHKNSRICVLTGYDRSGLIQLTTGREIEFLKKTHTNWFLKYENEDFFRVLVKNQTGSEIGSKLCSKFQVMRFDDCLSVGLYCEGWHIFSRIPMNTPYICNKNDGTFILEIYAIDQNQRVHALMGMDLTFHHLTYWVGKYLIIDNQAYGFLNKNNAKWLDSYTKTDIKFMLWISKQLYNKTNRTIGYFISKDVLLEHVLTYSLFL